jgi:putative nucleotidyltransferase with HDIG domain
MSSETPNDNNAKLLLQTELSSITCGKSNFFKILDLFTKYGSDKYMIDENITQLQHALQAAYIAKSCGAPKYVILGMLLHDIGQLIGQEADENINIEKLHRSHDDTGADFLTNEGFDIRIINIAKYHTYMKVLLCSIKPEYLSKLSKASQESYVIQKEKYKNIISDSTMDGEVLMACRLIDDCAKINDFTPGNILDYEELYDELKNQSLLSLQLDENDGDKKWIDNVAKYANFNM